MGYRLVVVGWVAQRMLALGQTFVLSKEHTNTIPFHSAFEGGDKPAGIAGMGV